MNPSHITYVGFLVMALIVVAVFIIVAGAISAAVEVGGTALQTRRKNTRVAFAVVSVALLIMIGSALLS